MFSWLLTRTSCWTNSPISDALRRHESPQLHHCITYFHSGALRAWAPSDFIPEKQGIDDVIAAFKGDTDGILDRGLYMGCGTNASVPGKMEEDKAIFGNDGKQGGTSIFRTKDCLLILVFGAGNPTRANRLGMELSDEMRQAGH